jgi:hypothetical protein
MPKTTRPEKSAKDLSPKSPSKVKGGLRMPSDDGGEVASPGTK